MASPRRTFLNKINKRIAALEKVGVNKERLLNFIQDQDIEGVFITEFNQVNIDPTQWQESEKSITRKLEQAFPTVYDAKEEALQARADFIGPLSKQEINMEVKGLFEQRMAYQDLKEKYGKERAKEISKKIREFRKKYDTTQLKGSAPQSGKAAQDLFGHIMDSLSPDERDRFRRETYDSRDILDVGESWVMAEDLDEGEYFDPDEFEELLNAWEKWLVE